MAVLTPEVTPTVLPDHTQLPEKDGSFVKNFAEHPQAILLTDSIGPVLKRLHPDGQYAIGQDSGIYWRLTPEPLEGCKAPDWYYVPNVPPLLGGQIRRSYVLWKELIAPLVILEFASDGGEEERDRTPMLGKFWVYEKAVRAPYYGVFEITNGNLEVYRLVDGSYQQMQPNEHGRYPITPLGVELGVWKGRYLNFEDSWLRWWDTEGNLLLTGAEAAEEERMRKEEAQHRTEEERRLREEAQRHAEEERRLREEAQRHAERMAERLRAAGIDPENV